MIYLSGCVRPDLPSGVGVMLTPMMGNRLPDNRVWAADTGCFNAPEKHDDDRYLSWLADRRHGVDRCLFATAPDVVGDAAATLDVGAPMLPRIRALGYPAALVLTDWMDEQPIPWDDFDVAFFGGSDTWKFSPRHEALMAESRRRGKWVHAGRVNSYGRLEAMAGAGAHSADGTYIAFGPDINGPRVAGWLAALEQQPHLFTTY